LRALGDENEMTDFGPKGQGHSEAKYGLKSPLLGGHFVTTGHK